MSGYRSLHREQVVLRGAGDDKNAAADDDDDDDVAIWDVATSTFLAGKSGSKKRTSPSSTSWRIWCACGDGLVRSFAVEEASVEAKRDALDASAASLRCTHLLAGPSAAAGGGGGTPRSSSLSSSHVALGCTRVRAVRNYVGEDTGPCGDIVVASIDLGGRVRAWCFEERSGSLDDVEVEEDGAASPPVEPRRVRSKVEFQVDDATGTTLEVCPPRSLGPATDLAAAIGCLDGTVAVVALGFVTPPGGGGGSGTGSVQKEREPKTPGTMVDVRGSRGSAVPLALCWHPCDRSSNRTLVVGRQDGVVDVLTETRKGQHRMASRHRHPVRAVSYNDDGHLLVSGCDAGLLCVWDVSRGGASAPPALVHHVSQAHDRGAWILGATCLPDSRRFVTFGSDRKIRVWDVGQMHQASHTFLSDRDVYAVARGGPSPSSSSSSSPQPLRPRLVTGGDGGWVQLYSVE